MNSKEIYTKISETIRWTLQGGMEISAPMRARILAFFRKHPRLIVFPVAGFGVLFFVLMVAGKSAPEKSQAAEQSTPVRVIVATQVAVVPRAVGYGYIQPGRNWDAVAEVAGKITVMHPQLREGGVISKGEELLRIDPLRSELAMVQSEANVSNVEAQIKELDQRESDLRRTYANERKALELSKSDLERYKSLIASGTIARSELDAVEQSYLVRANGLQSYRTQLNQIPAAREALNAQLASSQSVNENARLTLEKTVLTAPFNCRVAEMNVELGQAVQVGKVLAQLDSLGGAEAVAQVSLYTFNSLAPREAGSPFLQDLDAVIRVDFGAGNLEWRGTVVRVSDEVDPRTRTLGVYVAVDESALISADHQRSPLVKNMYAEVEILGAPLRPAVVVPRSAVRNGQVYLVGPENRLVFRSVEVDIMQGDMAVLSAGVAPGEQLVVSDLVPAVEGMLLNPVDDAGALEALLHYARGKGAVK